MDRIVARADRDAVRLRREQQAGRQFSIWDGDNGLAEVFGRLIGTDARALETLADTVRRQLAQPQAAGSRKWFVYMEFAVNVDNIRDQRGSQGFGNNVHLGAGLGSVDRAWSS
jgi:hypothetical protein